MADYKYDVFLSVKRDPIFGEWLEETFAPLFDRYLKNDIIAECKRPTIGNFYYRNSLEPGDPWPDDLREAIRRSRLAIALCSPEYFYSKWCLREFRSFLWRMEEKKAKVLVPVSIHDGEAFPSRVQDIQSADLSDFVIVGKGFKKTKKYTRLQEELKTLSHRIAKLVASAPDFEDWKVVEDVEPGQVPRVEQLTL